MQKFLAPFPLVRLLIPLVCGIVLGMYTDLSPVLLWICAITFLIGIGLTHFLLRKTSKLYPVNGAMIFLFFLCVGTMLLQYRENSFAQSKAQVTTEIPVMVRISSDPEPKENNVRCVAEVTAMLSDSQWIAVDAKTMLYLKRNATSEQLQYGDELFVMSGVRLPSPVMNPGEFDYAGWLEHRGIAFVCFAKEEWTKKAHSEPSWLKARALQLRNYFHERMVSCGLAGQELAVGEALLLGQSSEIDPQLLASYSASGTLHVLSVSGMHVALVFVVLLKLLSPLEKKKKGKWLSFAIQFFVIWFYAFMTGMSPSVLRAVTMLSVIIAGRIINRKAHLLNTLAASAVILLIGDPMLLEDAGFLLSYCAVAGIVIVQPMVEAWWKPRYRILRPLWSLVSVTIAAQVFTFPLGLYFFQQFPTWFIITNIVVIPLSTICLYAGLVFLALSWWTWAGTLFAVVFGLLISLLNASVGYTEFLPWSVIQTAHWTSTEIILVYSTIVLTIVALRMKIKKAAFATVACLLVLVLFIAAGKHHDAATREITFFHINRGIAVGIVEQDKVVLLTDSATLANPEQINFHVTPRYKQMGITDPESVEFAQVDSAVYGSVQWCKGFLFAGEHRYWMGNKEAMPPPGVRIDAFIIHSKNFWMIEELTDVQCAEIILTGEVKKKWQEKWTEEGKRRNVPVHVTGESGAKVVEF